MICCDCQGPMKIYNCGGHCPMCGYGKPISYKENIIPELKEKISNMFKMDNGNSYISLEDLESAQLLDIEKAFSVQQSKKT